MDIRRSVSLFPLCFFSAATVCIPLSLADLYFGQRSAVYTIKLIYTHTHTPGWVKPKREPWSFPYLSTQGHLEQTLSCCCTRSSCSIPLLVEIFGAILEHSTSLQPVLQECSASSACLHTFKSCCQSSASPVHTCILVLLLHFSLTQGCQRYGGRAKTSRPEGPIWRMGWICKCKIWKCMYVMKVDV